ncbi:hypothetical protein JXA88_16955 [Candidatus Fermentibacteria bacterium]|nr:hypothetical protein [Candidatus Fermentibacteria bacterium]
MTISDAEFRKFSKVLLALMPTSGEAKGNKKLMGELRKALKDKHDFDLTEDVYWEIRNALIQEGKLAKARGKGGSVRLVVAAAEGKGRKPSGEKELYAPISAYLGSNFVRENSIKHFVLQITAHQGKRSTGGKWTRPDITLAAVRTYTFTPGRYLEVITFEVKPAGTYEIEAVFETASHSMFAHKSYLVYECPDGLPDGDEAFDRLMLLCGRFGVGLLVFRDAEDPESYEEVVEPVRQNPDPASVDRFLSRQLSRENQSELQELVK